MIFSCVRARSFSRTRLFGSVQEEVGCRMNDADKILLWVLTSSVEPRVLRFQRRLGPVDVREAVARLPVADPHEVEPRALEDARMIAEREFLHPLQDEELDFSDLLEIYFFHV